jgi:hypothetical protein
MSVFIALKLQIEGFILHFHVIHHQSIVFHIDYLADLVAGHLQTCACILMRRPDHLWMKTSLSVAEKKSYIVILFL